MNSFNIKHDQNIFVKDIGDLIYELMPSSTNYSNYNLSIIKNRYISLMINENLSFFNDSYNILKEKGHTSENNAYVYGDIDYSIWIEETKIKGLKVIVNKCHCSDRKFLFIMKNAHIPDLMSFLCCTFEDEEVKSKFGCWGDHRDIDKPSLQTFRDYDFDFGYSDGRDKHHVFIYNQFTHSIDNSSIWTENDIHFALWQLRLDNNMLNDYDNCKC